MQVDNPRGPWKTLPAWYFAGVTVSSGERRAAFRAKTGEAKPGESANPCPTTGTDTPCLSGRIRWRGNHTLGYNLKKMALYTLAQGESTPAYVLFMNDGVKLPAGEERSNDTIQPLIR